MQIETFEDLLDRYGPQLTQWPQTERVEAQALLIASAPARAMLDTAVRIEASLASTVQHRASSDLQARILEEVGTSRIDAWLDWLGRRLWRPVLVATAPLFAGLFLGTAIAQPVSYTEVDPLFENSAIYEAADWADES